MTVPPCSLVSEPNACSLIGAAVALSAMYSSWCTWASCLLTTDTLRIGPSLIRSSSNWMPLLRLSNTSICASIVWKSSASPGHSCAHAHISCSLTRFRRALRSAGDWLWRSSLSNDSFRLSSNTGRPLSCGIDGIISEIPSPRVHGRGKRNELHEKAIAFTLTSDH